MTIRERYRDVAKRTGLSEDIIRGVFDAIQKSLVDSIVSDGKATMPGICTLTTDLRSQIVFNPKTMQPEQVPYVKIRAKPTSTLEVTINNNSTIQKEPEEFNVDLEAFYAEEPIIRTQQIGALL